MTVRERVLALRFMEKQKKNPEFAKRLGVEVTVERASDERELQKTNTLIVYGGRNR